MRTACPMRFAPSHPRRIRPRPGRTDRPDHGATRDLSAFFVAIEHLKPNINL
jgi:hypothetical protein